jgi:hypothetical protein
MKTVLSLLLLSGLGIGLSSTAHADESANELANFVGPANCKVARLQSPPADGMLRWSGACKDGYAEGDGVLEWTSGAGPVRLEGRLARGAVDGEAKLKVGERFSYIGKLTGGMPDGEGYLKFAGGVQYEGGIRMMRREGQGLQIYPNGDVYQGDFHNDRIDGQGKLTYALGGMIEGAFHNGHPVDGDRITYAGSGRTGTLDIAARSAARAAARAAVGEPNEAKLHDDEAALGTLMPRTIMKSTIPANLGWDALTPAQKDYVRSEYPALEPGDEPPYPLNGSVEFSRLVHAAANKYEARGELRLHVLVGADGKAKEVRKVGSFDDQMVRYVGGAAMAQRYKPAVCHGQPCEMLYPIDIRFEYRIQ